LFGLKKKRKKERKKKRGRFKSLQIQLVSWRAEVNGSAQ